MSNPPRRMVQPIQRTQRLPNRPPRPQRRGQTFERHPRHRRTCMPRFIAAAVLVLALLCGTAIFVYQRVMGVLNTVQIDAPPIAQEDGPPPDVVREPFNVLLIGYDLREADEVDGARSDTLILVHVDPENNWASMLSIPRDSYAYIPKKDVYEKINAAYSYGYDHPDIYGGEFEPRATGGQLAMEAVEELLQLEAHGTRIHYNVQVDFNGFKQIVDTIGGINLDVPKPLLDPEYPTDDGDNGFMRLYIPAGLQHMDGTTALRYARSRHVDSDFGRSERQQQVIRAILSSVKERGMLDQILTGDAVAQDLKSAVVTTLPIKDPRSLKALAGLANVLSGDRLYSYAINEENVSSTVDLNPYQIHWDEDDLDAVVSQWLRGPGGQQNAGQGSETEAPATVSVQVVNGAGIPGLAGDVTDHLQALGFGMLDPDTAVDRYDHTQLIDFGDNSAARDALARQLGIKSRYIRIQPADAPSNPQGADLILILGSDYQEEWRGAGGN